VGVRWGWGWEGEGWGWMGRTGNLALTSARALPATPPETLNSSYVCTFSTGADVPVAAFLLSLIGAAKAPVRERKIVSGVEKCMISNILCCKLP
jgi:hypothetical protein